MKTFLKIVGLVILAVIAIKLLPLTLALGFILGLLAVGLVVLGMSIVAALACLTAVVAAALAPIWIPVLVVAGIVALLRRSSRRPA